MINTIIAGVFVYIIGQFTLKLIIEPLQELIKEIKKTKSLLIYYKLTYSKMEHYQGLDGRKTLPNIVEELREQASLISSQSSIIIGFFVWKKLKLLPSEEEIEQIVKNIFKLATITLTDLTQNKISKEDMLLVNTTINLLSKVESI